MPYGQLSHVMWQQQQSFGVTSDLRTTSLQTIPVISENLHLNIEPLLETGNRASFAEPPYQEGKHFVDGTIEMDANDLSIGWLLKGVMGRVKTTSGSTYPPVTSFDAYLHEFEPLVDSYFDARAALPPNTIEIFRDAGNAFQYYNMLVNRLTLEGTNGELVKLTADFLGGNLDRSNAADVSCYLTEAAFMWDQACASYDGADLALLRNFTVNINNNLEVLHLMTNSKTPYRIRRGKLEVDMSGTLLFDTHSHQLAFENQDEKRFKIVFKATEATSASHLVIDIPLFRFTDFNPIAQGDGIVEASFTGRGMYSGSGSPILITLTNTQDYYTGSVTGALDF